MQYRLTIADMTAYVDQATLGTLAPPGVALLHRIFFPRAMYYTELDYSHHWLACTERSNHCRLQVHTSKVAVCWPGRSSRACTRLRAGRFRHLTWSTLSLRFVPHDSNTWR
ncbi:hypothetical protein DOTSEDRAFT_71423, partial [Dothistroma septosporum NZE10]